MVETTFGGNLTLTIYSHSASKGARESQECCRCERKMSQHFEVVRGVSWHPSSRSEGLYIADIGSIQAKYRRLNSGGI